MHLRASATLFGVLGLIISQPATAQGIALFGDARLGLGYNIDNAGEATGEDDVRAISRVRFGVSMTGETDSGIAFGAIIRGDNAPRGQGGTVGQSAGSVFASGAWGSLTFGDTNGADEQWVGDLNEVGLTCLGCQNETPFVSNGGGFGEDEEEFADNPLARPTIRYDFDYGDFGASLSTNRDLTDIGVGGGWSGAVGGGTLAIGVGYYDYAAFTTVGEPQLIVVSGEDGLAVVEGTPVETSVAGGTQWSASIGGTFGDFNGKVVYTTADSEADASFDLLGAGLGATFGPWALNAYYFNVLDAKGPLDPYDGRTSYGAGVNYDLGGGALVRTGVVRTYADETVADLGISLNF